MAAGYTATVCLGNTAVAIPPIFLPTHYMPVGYLSHLKAIRKQRGMTQAEVAERAGVEQPTYQRWETGKREPESLAQLFSLANALGVEPGALIDPSAAVPIGPRLFVKGEVAAGTWKPAVEWPEPDWQAFNGRADVTADKEFHFGLRVAGDSMDMVYPPGTIVECVSLFGGAEALPGKRVILLREDEHGLFEATVKELVERDDGLWLVPRSYNPAHRPFRIDELEPGIVGQRITAVVVASVRPE